MGNCIKKDINYQLLKGNIESGLCKANSFTQLDWVSEQCRMKLGIDPYPGTLNLRIRDQNMLLRWLVLRNTEGIILSNPGGDACNARCYPVLVEEQFSAAILYPEISNYPSNQVEVIAPVSLRKSLNSDDGDEVILSPFKPLDVKAVILDLDGTLVNTIGAFYFLAKRVATDYGLDISRSQVLHSLNHGTSFWDAILSHNATDKSDMVKLLTESSHKYWPEIIRQYAYIMPGIVQIIKGLRRDGYKLGIVTGSSGGSLELLYSTGVASYFDVVVTGKDVKSNKPDPEGLNKCLDQMGIEPVDSVYVGDTAVDMLTAHAAGTKPIGVLSGAGNSVQLCEAGAYRIIYSLSGLPKLLGSARHV